LCPGGGWQGATEKSLRRDGHVSRGSAGRYPRAPPSRPSNRCFPWARLRRPERLGTTTNPPFEPPEERVESGPPAFVFPFIYQRSSSALLLLFSLSPHLFSSSTPSPRKAGQEGIGPESASDASSRNKLTVVEWLRCPSSAWSAKSERPRFPPSSSPHVCSLPSPLSHDKTRPRQIRVQKRAAARPPSVGGVTSGAALSGNIVSFDPPSPTLPARASPTTSSMSPPSFLPFFPFPSLPLPSSFCFPPPIPFPTSPSSPPGRYFSWSQPIPSSREQTNIKTRNHPKSRGLGSIHNGSHRLQS